MQKLNRHSLRSLIKEEMAVHDVDSELTDKNRTTKKGTKVQRTNDLTVTDRTGGENRGTSVQKSAMGKVVEQDKSFIGRLTKGKKKTNYNIKMYKHIGGKYDGKFGYNMYFGQQSKFKKSEVILRINQDGEIRYEAGKSPLAKHPEVKPKVAIRKLKKMGIDPEEVLDILKKHDIDADIEEARDEIEKAMGGMSIDESASKINRRQLRALIIETLEKY
tara:strand:- start:293 stop:946 length:654 start_codon:yes stop_codon:yes gene_type:complete